MGLPRSALPFSVLVLLVLPAAGQSTDGSDLGALSATAGADGVTLRWQPGDDGEAILAVSHLDGHGERIVDWVGSLAPNGDGPVEVVLQGLPADAGLEAHLFESDRWSTPTMSAVTPLPTAVPNGTDLPPALPLQTDPRDQARSFHAYRVSPEHASEPTAFIGVTPGGAVAVAWNDVQYEDGPCALRAAFSLDGGHTFGAPIQVHLTPGSSSVPCQQDQRWVAAVLSTGLLAIVWDERSDGQPASLVLLDPLSSQPIGEPRLLPGVEFNGIPAAQADRDGGLALASQTALRSPMHLWHISHDGAVRSGPDLTDGSAWVYYAEGAGNGQHAVLAWVDSRGSAEEYRYRLWASHSSDGGRTFGKAAEVPLPDMRQVALESLQMGHNGTAHFVVSDYNLGGSFYVRQAPNGTVTRVPLCGAAGAVMADCDRAQNGELAVSGSHVWLLFQPLAQTPGAAHVAAESWDDGLTFAAPYAIADPPGNRMSMPFDVAAFPDGRPILYGLFFFGEPEEAHHGVVPLFDPLAPVAAVRNGTVGRVPSPMPDASYVVEEATSLANATRVLIRNTGTTTWHSAVLEAVDESERMLGRLEAVAVAPGGRLEGELPLPKVASGTTVRIVVAGQQLGAPFDVKSLVVPGPPEAQSNGSASSGLPDALSPAPKHSTPLTAWPALLVVGMIALARRPR